MPGGIAGCAGGAWLIVRGIRQVVAGAKAAGDPDQSSMVIAGFRTGILGIGLLCLGVALWRWSAPWALFAAIFLFEEFVETTVQSLAARAGARHVRRK